MRCFTMTTSTKNDPFDDRQRWWWRFLLPAGIGLLALFWTWLALGRIEEKSGQPLYALFAYTDSAGTGKIDWKGDGQHQVFLSVALPFYAGLTGLLVSLLVGAAGIRRGAGTLALVGYLAYGLICAIVLCGIFACIWAMVIGLFI